MKQFRFLLLICLLVSLAACNMPAPPGKSIPLTSGTPTLLITPDFTQSTPAGTPAPNATEEQPAQPATPQSSPPAASTASTNVAPAGDVKYLRASDNLRVRIGPGTTYDTYSILPQGTVVEVRGKSPDGQWYLIVCPNTTSPTCWITADPTLSVTAQAP